MMNLDKTILLGKRRNLNVRFITQVCKHWEISPRNKVWRQTGMRANVELFIEQQGIERWSTE